MQSSAEQSYNLLIFQTTIIITKKIAGNILVTGSEDSYIKIQTLDQDYFDFDFEY